MAQNGAGQDRLKSQLIAGELEAVEIADDGGSQPFGCKEFTGDPLHVVGGDALEQSDQLFCGEVAVEVEVIARKVVHARGGALEREQCRALKMVLGTAEFFFAQRFILKTTELLEDRTNHLPSGLHRCAGIDREHPSVAVRIRFAEDCVGEALTLSDVLEKPGGHAAAEDVIEDGHSKTTIVGQGQGRNPYADVYLLELALCPQGYVRGGSRRGVSSVLTGRRQLGKALGYKLDHLRVTQMPRGGDDQVIGRVPSTKPFLKRAASERRDRLRSAEDRFTESVRHPEILCKELVNQILGIILRHANLFEDYRLLTADVVRREFRLEDHVSEYVECFWEVLVEHSRVEADHLLGSEGVEHTADAIDFPGDVLGRSARRALEYHVLDEVRNAVQRRRFTTRSRPEPDADRNGMDVCHRLGQHHQAVRQNLLLDGASSVGHRHTLFLHGALPMSLSERRESLRGGPGRSRVRPCARLPCYDDFKMSHQAAHTVVNLLGKPAEELRAILESRGEQSYRGAQIYHALYRERQFDFAAMTNLPAALREELSREAVIALPEIVRRHTSADGTVRYVVALGEAKPGHVETVFMPEERRQTVCVSAQVGCAVDCQFCLTARLRGVRNLLAGEMIGQVLVALEDNRATLRPQTNVVFMGQGEPLLNYDAVMAALGILLDPNGMAISPKHVTVSTSGIVPAIERLAQEKARPKLAISLNASSNDQRNKIMPINRKYPLERLLDACRRYPLRPWERLTFEYVLLGGFNDSPDDASRVRALLANLRAKVNLIPWNPGPLPFEKPDPARVDEFRRILQDKGMPAFVRHSRGQDVMAACGQLALSESAAGSGVPPRNSPDLS